MSTLVIASLGVACASSPAAQVADEAALGAPSALRVDDDPSLDPIVDDPLNPLLRDVEPITQRPDARYDEDTSDGLDAAQLAAATTPNTYIALRNRKPRPFAAATVLAAFRRLRRYYHTKPYRVPGANVSVTAQHAVGITASHHRSLRASGAFGVDLVTHFDDFELTWNTTSDASDGDNLRLMPISWSELQAHFFVLAPHRRHGCWTLAIRNGAPSCPNPFAPEVTAPPATARDIWNGVCSGSVPLRPDLFSDASCRSWAEAISVIPVQMSAYNLLWVDPATRTFVKLPEDVRTALDLQRVDPGALADLKSVRFANEQRAKGRVNVWDYIMLSQLYAFDWDQQQAVLNTFYGDNKRFAGDAVSFDPNDATDCVRWRPVRPGDPTDGTHCRVDKVMGERVLSNGR